jgi:NAD+ diphosphatase
MSFTPGFKPSNKNLENALWFLFQNQKLLMKEDADNLSTLTSEDLRELNIKPIGSLFLGLLDDKSCYAGELHDPELNFNGLKFFGLRDIFNRFDESMIQVAGLANQLLNWNKRHRYCGNCGNPTKDKEDERAKICHECHSIYYPRLSPAIIVAVRKGDRILLANSTRFTAKYYSTLAGFVEPGETLEECVKREIFEEVGIKVRNIKYFGSQPWPFPDSLMIGFTAEYASGKIKIDGNEIADAGWFSPEDMPLIPPSISIARRLIDGFLRGQSAKKER